MKFTAELVEDSGRAASGPDFFRSAEFLEAEETTHSLLVFEEGGDGSGQTELVASAPLLVRGIPGSDRLDGISPYGYPGLAISDGPLLRLDFPIDPASIDFSATGLVTVFLRHPLGGDPPLAEATARNVCLLSDPALPRKSRASDRQQIRKNLKRGCTVEITPGQETSPEQRAGFFTAYTETMSRTGASDRYFFSESYFDLILSAENTWLFILRTPEGEAAAASIAALSDGLLHYYLSGTADAHLKGAPMKNVVEEMIAFGAERELAVNFGGGISPGDALEEFKRGFANREEQWFTSEIVCDPAAAAELTKALVTSQGRDAEPGFFPPYRA
ncbi:MAG: GNAT family N-acetyltransferase [Solirubrobacterales bacterium]|nr:GNAT family N-acetyltransferase [Solirubrobacterales bacterium]MCB0860193.1 GNAT family N-acetyltransferase [Solirubrobacterales bacterium]